MNNRNLIRNIKLLLFFFSLCFMGIIIYLTSFSYYKAHVVVKDAINPRMKEEENDVLRGAILDSEGKAIVHSELESNDRQKRIYNNGEAFAHVIGYNSALYGKTGVELAYNDVLQGKGYGGEIIDTLFQGFKNGFKSIERKGYDVQLSIDREAQLMAYKMLGNSKGAVAAINTRTGEIIALVSKPTFSPIQIDNNFEKYNNDMEGTPFVNRAASGYYAPGSIFKIITAAAALEGKPQLVEKTYSCNGGLKIGDYTLVDHGNKSHGKLSLQTAFKVSCNNTFGQIGIELGYDALEKMAEEFMFNKKLDTNDSFSSLNIKAGKIVIDNEKQKALIAQDAIGQHGVTTNPLHMALVTAAIANDGVMMKPYLVKTIRTKDGAIIDEGKVEKLNTVVSKTTAEQIQKYMLETVKSGTGTRARISGIQVAGKTGSAENENHEETHSWFTAFAPYDNPEIAVTVIVEEGGIGGGKAAEIAREVIKAYLK